MPVFQRSFFETNHSELPSDPAIRANVWADRFREIITSMDVDFLAGDATLFGRHNMLIEWNGRRRRDAELVVQGNAGQAAHSPE